MDELYRSSSSFGYSSSMPYPTTTILGDGSSSSSYHHTVTATAPSQYHCSQSTTYHHHHHHHHHHGQLIKAQIANHPLYPTLLSSYIDCTKLVYGEIYKVGAPPEMASVLEEIRKENHQHPIYLNPRDYDQIGPTHDPQLDHFMKSYCDALHKYKEEISKPFNEATNFLSTIGSQLTDLCKETLIPYHSTQSSTTWEEMRWCSREEEEEDQLAAAAVEDGINMNDYSNCNYDMNTNNNSNAEELKEMLMRKYSGYVRSLRKEMLKKRKKGKLPKDAISALLEWWSTHYRWPYPTEEEKNRLSETTGLDQKQINNWFINQRKRHWRPSQDMAFALMEGVSTGDGGVGAAAAAAAASLDDFHHNHHPTYDD